MSPGQLQRWFIIGGFAIICVFTVWHITSATAIVVSRANLQRELPYQIGDVLPQIQSLDNRTDKTLLLFVRSGCGYCTASMPFYRSLATATGGRVSVVAVCVERLDVCTAYLRRQELATSAVFALVGSGLNVTATPTVILIDGDRRVHGVWLGQQDSAGQKEIRQKLTA